ncbi:MAG: hypothetical protein ACM3PF_07820 [Bacteroidota bacterium]
MRRIVLAVLAALVIAAVGYVLYVAAAWIGFGHAKRVAPPEAAVVSLDRFLPSYDVTERHETRVRAPAPVTYAAARDLDLQQSPLVRAIFKGRELILGSHGKELARRSFLSQVQGMGWGLLAEVPGRALVFGAVTRPWEANVKFHPLPPARFAAFQEPGWAKIVWTLEVDPAGPDASVFRTQTRVATTDPVARKRFRQYWATLSPGILLIRHQALGLVKSDAERRARAGSRVL